MKKIKIDIDPELIYLTADLHYQHKNIITLDDRNQYKDLSEMEEDIRTKLQETLKPEHILIDLGDMFFGTRDNKLKALISSIPCPIYKILGNHDKEDYFISRSDMFLGIYDSFILELRDGTRITLTHYPILDYPYMYSGGLELFGHTHGHLDSFIDSIPYLMLDLGFSAGYSKKTGKFIHKLSDILDYFRNTKMGGSCDGNFNRWAQENYHTKKSLWR